MDCEQALERMSETLDGPLSPQAREELDDHLARCPHCAALFEALKGQSQVLRELDPPFPEGLHQKVLDNLPPQRPARKAGKVLHFRRWAALAACAVLAVALGVTRPWQDRSATDGSDSPAAYWIDPAVCATQADPRTQRADSQIVYSQLPEGWEDILGDVSPESALLSSEDALAFLSLLEEQGIPYTIEGDATFSGTCQLILAEK